MITNLTKGQSREVIEKIDDMRKLHPNLAREISDLKSSSNDAKVEFHNGSWIKIVASNDGARSKLIALLFGNIEVIKCERNREVLHTLG